MATMKLYYVPRTSAGRPRWMLEELGVPYELVRLDPSKGETRTPEHRKLHPLGHVPVFVDGDSVMFESAAIVLYLADKFPEKHLAPALGSPARMQYLQWSVYAMTEVMPPLMQVLRHTAWLPEDKRVPALAEEARKTLAEAFAAVERALAGRQWLVGDDFTAADLLLGGAIVFAARTPGLLDGTPGLKAYAERLQARPAWQRATKD